MHKESSFDDDAWDRLHLSASHASIKCEWKSFPHWLPNDPKLNLLAKVVTRWDKHDGSLAWRSLATPNTDIWIRQGDTQSKRETEYRNALKQTNKLLVKSLDFYISWGATSNPKKKNSRQFNTKTWLDKHYGNQLHRIQRETFFIANKSTMVFLSAVERSIIRTFSGTNLVFTLKNSTKAIWWLNKNPNELNRCMRFYSEINGRYFLNPGLYSTFKVRPK